MRTLRVFAMAGLVSNFAYAPAALSFPIAAPGTECLRLVVSGTDPIVATYQGNSAAFSNDLYLALDAAGRPGDDGNTANDRFIFNNHASTVGSTVDLGSFPVGTELVFRLYVNDTGISYLTGPASRNPDAHCHARAQTSWSPHETLVSFEDLFGGPDDYNDLSFSFTNTVSSRITLTPPAATNLVGTSHTVTATVQDPTGAPLASTVVVFSILNGPNAGLPGICAANVDCSTDAAGQVSFTYDGIGGEGTDTIGACFVDASETQFCSQPVTKTWTSTGCTEGQPCDDGNSCTTGDICTEGACHGAPVICTPLDDCHLAGVCELETGKCTNPTAEDRTACNDGNPCTQLDLCEDGVCIGEAKIACTAEGDCLAPGTCDPSTGECSEPVPAPDGTACDTDGVCFGGECDRVPSCDTAAPSVASLWPPDDRWVEVSVLGISDPDGDPVAIRIDGIAQDEQVSGPGSGDTCPDATGQGSSTASLRSERSATEDGRVYHIKFTADDGRGGACSGEVAVCVPHDNSARSATCGDAGTLHDSGGACVESPDRKAATARR